MLRLHIARITTAATAAVALATAIVAVPQAAQAAPASVPAPPCHGASCVGQQPTLGNWNRNCAQGIYNGNLGAYTDSAYDVTTFTLPAWAGGASVTLRYSPYCAANWARWNGGDSYTDYWVETWDGRTARGYSGNLPNYTTMVDGTQLARVCADESQDQVSGCSGWY
jgi:hypothetical protein